MNIICFHRYYEAAAKGSGPWMLKTVNPSPAGSNAHCAGACTATITVVKSALAQEVHQTFGDDATGWVRQVRY